MAATSTHFCWVRHVVVSVQGEIIRRRQLDQTNSQNQSMDWSCLHPFQVLWLPHLCLWQWSLTRCIWCLLSPSTCYLRFDCTRPYHVTLLWLDSNLQKRPRFRSLRPPSLNARPRKHHNDNAQQNKRWLAWQVPHVRFDSSLHNDRIQTSRLHRLSDRHYQILGRPA